jgi:hypothetical protein
MAGGHTVVVTKRRASTYNTARHALRVLLDLHSRWDPGAVPALVEWSARTCNGW